MFRGKEGLWSLHRYDRQELIEYLKLRTSVYDLELRLGNVLATAACGVPHRGRNRRIRRTSVLVPRNYGGRVGDGAD